MSASVRIACRVRPFINSEARDDSVEVLDDTSVSIINPQDVGKRFRFNFTSVHGQDATQDQLFDRDVLPLLGHVFNGLTVTIFAYGVTSSGKTHTMQGSLDQPGIIPRVVDALFQRKATMSQEDVSLELSYMEIYKDDVFDLMVSAREAKLPVREDGRGKVFVANLTETCIETTDEFDTHFIAACKSRSVAATNFNRASSRSHAILGIKVTVKGKYPGAPTLIGKVNLVDLAGSENNKMTGNDAVRMAESAAINKSLSVLGQVVHALNQRAARIPYRDSKLTRILQDALGGSSISLLICNIAPGARFKQDTLNTLNFATRTKEIENRPVVNQKAPPAPPPAAAPQSGIGIGRPPRRASITSSSHSGAVSASTSGIPVQSRRMSFGMRHVSAGPSVTGSGAVGTSRIQPPTHGRRASSVGHSRRTSISGVGGENVVIGLTEKEVEAKIASAVQAALAKREQELKEHAMQEVQRMEEERRRREKEEQEEEDRRRREKEQEEMRRQEEEWQRRRAMEVTEELTSGPPSYSSVATASNPRNLLDRTLVDGDMSAPLVQRHLQLLRRVETLEQSRDGPTDMEVAVTMDYATRKKVAKSLIKRARMYQTQNDLPSALQYYLKAQPYAADNVKLQHRIDKLREAIEAGKPFLPSPTSDGGRYNNDSLACRTVATPSRKRSRVGALALAEVTNEGDDCEDVEMDVDELGMKRRRSFVEY